MDALVDIDIDLAALDAIYEAQAYDMAQDGYDIGDFWSDVNEVYDFLYDAFGFDDDTPPEPCGDIFSGDDEPCGTPPGPGDWGNGDIINDEIIANGISITPFDLATWSLLNASYLIYGEGWGVLEFSGGTSDTTPEGNENVNANHPDCSEPPFDFVSWVAFNESLGGDRSEMRFLNAVYAGYDVSNTILGCDFSDETP